MAESPPDAYGARFLRALKERLQSTAGLKYATVKALEGADREAFAGILRRELPWLPYAVYQMIATEEPEQLAQWFADEIQRQAGSAVSAFFLMMP